LIRISSIVRSSRTGTHCFRSLVTPDAAKREPGSSGAIQRRDGADPGSRHGVSGMT
jgi:hypothetical protein